MTVENVAFGIILDDLVFPDGKTQMGVLGGGGPQTAWGMAVALGSGKTVGLVAGVGSDFDENQLTPLKNAGINLDGVRVTDYPTPRAWQILEADGRRTQVWRTPVQILGRQLAKNWEVLPYKEARRFHWGIHPGETDVTFAQELKEKGLIVSLEAFKAPDTSLSAAQLSTLLDACDIFSANRAETEAIWGTASRKPLLALQTIFVRRDGEQGATVFYRGTSFRVPAIQVSQVDVTGAGNAFCGALLARIEEGIENAVCHGITAASYMIEQIGLPEHLPDRIDYERRFNAVKNRIFHDTENDY